MFNMAGNPEAQFSHVVAHIMKTRKNKEGLSVESLIIKK